MSPFMGKLRGTFENFDWAVFFGSSWLQVDITRGYLDISPSLQPPSSAGSCARLGEARSQAIHRDLGCDDADLNGLDGDNMVIMW